MRISVTTTGSGAPSALPLKLAYVNSLLQTGTRSPIDRAIVEHVKEAEQSAFSDVLGESWIKLGEIPFDSARRLLSVLVSRSDMASGDGWLITKGAVEEVVDRCVNVYTHQRTSSVSDAPEPVLPKSAPQSLHDLTFNASTTTALTADERQRILDTAERLNADGLRLVAVACRTALVKPFMALTASDEAELTFVGFLGLLDPLKPGAADAVRELGKLNVQVRILTGDAPAVATKVARDLGILCPPQSAATGGAPEKDVEASPYPNAAVEPFDEKALIATGAQLAALADDKEAFGELVERCIIFAKLSPYQKLQVVQTLRRGTNRAVAFLGDGVNDALAIRGADVGISVDSGTEIAKEAADVILLEKSLAVVANGVLQGRMT